MGKCCDAVKACCGEEKQMKSQAKTGVKKQRKKRSDAGKKRGTKGSKSKTMPGKEDYTGKKGLIKKSAGKDVAKDNKKRDYEKPKKQRKKRSDAGKKRGTKAKATASKPAPPAKKQRKKRSDAGKKRGGKKSTSTAMVVRKKVKRKKVPGRKALMNRPYNQTLPPIRQVMSQNTNLPPPSAYMGKQIVPFIAPPQAKKRNGGSGSSAGSAGTKLSNKACNKKVRKAYRRGVEEGKMGRK
jgi:hypothetical protein